MAETTIKAVLSLLRTIAGNRPNAPATGILSKPQWTTKAVPIMKALTFRRESQGFRKTNEIVTAATLNLHNFVFLVFGKLRDFGDVLVSQFLYFIQSTPLFIL